MNPVSGQAMPTRSSFTASKAIAVLAVLYGVGVLGTLLSIHDQFLLLTPINLLLSLFIVLRFHPNWRNGFVLVLFVSYFVGFLAELYGVQSGLLFGEYQYGPVLGLKFYDTPLMIGVNWMLLVYCTGVTVNRFLPQSGWLLKSLVAAAVMVSLDVLIEPVAMHYDFWSWKDNVVPNQNYYAWFFVSLPLFILFFLVESSTRNKVGFALLLLQFLFFWLLGLDW